MLACVSSDKCHLIISSELPRHWCLVNAKSPEHALQIFIRWYYICACSPEATCTYSALGNIRMLNMQAHKSISAHFKYSLMQPKYQIFGQNNLSLLTVILNIKIRTSQQPQCSRFTISYWNWLTALFSVIYSSVGLLDRCWVQTQSAKQNWNCAPTCVAQHLLFFSTQIPSANAFDNYMYSAFAAVQ